MKNGRPHRKKSFTLPIAVVAGMIPAAMRVYSQSSGGIQGMTKEVGRIMMGYDWYTGQWNFGLTRYGLQPMLAGLGIHWAAGKLGINRMIARAGIPIMRL